MDGAVGRKSQSKKNPQKIAYVSGKTWAVWTRSK